MKRSTVVTAAVRAAKAGVATIAIACCALLGAAFAPTLLGYESLIVTSGSMGDAMPMGSVAVTKLVDGRAIARGDIITYRASEKASMPTTHRVVAIDEENGRRIFTTKGDANQTNDVAPVVVSGPIHRVERVVPYAGSLVSFVRTPVGAVLVFLVPIIGLVADGARGRSKKRAKPEPESHLDLPGWSVTTMLLAQRRSA